MTWHTGPLVPFDLETTGVDTRTARIVTAYVGMIGPRRKGGRLIEDRVQVLVNPGVPIPAGATKVHGITDEQAQAKGVEPAGAVNAIAEELARALKARIPVVGHNIAYDLSLLHWECMRHNVATVAERMGLSPDRPYGPIIDTYVLDKAMDSYRSGSRKLDDSKGPGVATHYGVPLTAAHDATADAIAAAHVAVKIKMKFGDEVPDDLKALHQSQKWWRADQQASLQRHFRTKKGKPDAYCDPCWPLCTDLSHPSGD